MRYRLNGRLTFGRPFKRFPLVRSNEVYFRLNDRYDRLKHLASDPPSLDAEYMNIDRVVYKVKRNTHWTDDKLWVDLPIFSAL